VEEPGACGCWGRAGGICTVQYALHTPKRMLRSGARWEHVLRGPRVIIRCLWALVALGVRSLRPPSSHSEGGMSRLTEGVRETRLVWARICTVQLGMWHVSLHHIFGLLDRVSMPMLLLLPLLPLRCQSLSAQATPTLALDVVCV
jgi:hypothetical protein